MTNSENNVAAQAGDEPMDYAEQLRAAVETVCEGWTLPPGARKTLETALWAPRVSPRATADVERESCAWTHEEENYAWASACGELWSFIDGGPEENRVKFCQGCGKPVAIDAAIATTKPGA